VCADVGHARANEYLINLIALHGGEEACIIGVVWNAENGFFDVVEIDFNSSDVFRLGVGTHQHRIGKPLAHRGNAPFDRAPVAIPLADHPFEHRDVGLEILHDWLFVEIDSAPRGGTLGTGVRQLKRLLALEVAKALDLQDATREDVLFALLLNGQQTHLDSLIRDGVHQIAKGDARLHLARKAHQHRLGHV